MRSYVPKHVQFALEYSRLGTCAGENARTCIVTLWKSHIFETSHAVIRQYIVAGDCDLGSMYAQAKAAPASNPNEMDFGQFQQVR